LTKKLATLQEVLMDLAQLRLGKLEIKRKVYDYGQGIPFNKQDQIFD
jgi:K+-sensing histidine kinase KdpD